MVLSARGGSRSWWFQRRPVIFVSLLGLLVCGWLLLIKSHLHAPSFHGEAAGVRGKGTLLPQVHICLCSDDTDLRPAAVAMRSVVAGAANPERLVFHFITAPQYSTLFSDLFQQHLPGVNIEVHHDAVLQKKIAGLIHFRKSSRARRSLASPFNFAPFYLQEFLGGRSSGRRLNAQRLIYLDTDTVIQGDIAEFRDMDLQGHSCAAVKYCLQHFEDYISFEQLRELGLDQMYNPKSCIANRGILVIDVAKWNAQNITGKIEEWMHRYRIAQSDLWFSGMSQPPWLLAVNGDYLELGDEWNCNGLGRHTMSMWESTSFRKNGMDHKALKQLGVDYGDYGSITPYVVTCSGTGKLLHYNGLLKPWLLDVYGKRGPVCQVPQRHVSRHWKWNATVRIYCDDVMFVSCSEVWSMYISYETACALKDFDKEWREDEDRWQKGKRDDLRDREKERKDREKKEQEKSKEKKEKNQKDKDDKEDNQDRKGKKRLVRRKVVNRKADGAEKKEGNKKEKTKEELKEEDLKDEFDREPGKDAEKDEDEEPARDQDRGDDKEEAKKEKDEEDEEEETKGEKDEEQKGEKEEEPKAEKEEDKEDEKEEEKSKKEGDGEENWEKVDA
mmetsp:Transcript_27377/g.61583  ORF Transcript_27377/g.61583 Transcript_27377/m.61583 type:complete len:613 (+) Transcript_27377:59-1897(+)